MSDKVRYEVDEAVATITIDRPEVRNAMDYDTFARLYELGNQAWHDSRVRAVVVTGEGNFSSGIDTTIFTRPRADGAEPAAIDIGFLQRAFTVFEEMPKPVIAAVAGPAFGAGLQLAIACDLRVAAQDVQLCVMEIRWGLIPDLGGTQRLPRLVGLSRARDMAYTARRVGAAEALAWGLVDRVAAPGEHLHAARALATELATGPPLALAAVKRLTAAAFDQPVDAGLEREAAAQRRILGSADVLEAVAARVEKRPPRFSGS